ncbi:site-2 protease family protein [Candidatus Gracilibacteria bacterium]|nr:site-2 protease family protein [Candidatus Gracilibacteria bacterium]
MGIDFLEIIQLAIILLVSIGLHEYAHAYVSYKLGDPTPKLQNRLTPNPLKHLDPIGFLMIFLINFGRGKPVQVNPMYYKNPLKGELMVALAGPATNLILSTIGIIIILIYSKILGYSITSILQTNTDIVNIFRLKFSIINIALAIFNMIPIPPLDGFRIIKMLRFKASQIIEKYTIYISIAFLLIILGPGQSIVGNFLSKTSFFIFNILFTIFGNIFY